MGVHGSVGARGAGTSSLDAAARLAAMSCCPPAALPSAPLREAPQRAPVRGGGPQHAQQFGQPHAHGDPRAGMSGAEPALHLRCAPGPQAPVPGRGSAELAGHPGRAVDPAVLALATMLGNAAVPERPPAALNQLVGQLVGQLATLIADGSQRVLALLPGHGDDTGAGSPADPARPGAARGEGPPATVVPQQPPPPPPLGPILTLDPRLGTIVEVGDGSDAEGLPPRTGDDAAQAGLPTSWVPVVSGLLRDRVRSGAGALADRIAALLDELGVTRLQLLALTLVAPLVVAFLIDVVEALLG